MAQKHSGFTQKKTAKIKTSNTGHAEDPAYKARLSSKNSAYMGGEQTSDGAKVERKIEKGRKPKNTRPSRKKEKASLRELTR